jgi:hypothetical protein
MTDDRVERVASDRPDDIPEDIWREAQSVAYAVSADLTLGAFETIAHAILAERERCAGIRPVPDITEEGPTDYESGYYVGFWDCHARFKDGILKPKPPSPIAEGEEER